MAEPAKRIRSPWPAAAGAAAAAVLAAALLWTPRTGGQAADRARAGASTAPPSEAAAEPPGALAAARDPAPDPEAPAAPPARAPAKPRHAILDVEVVDERGLPAPGATVVAYGTFEWDRGSEPSPVRAEGTAGADGRLALEVPVFPRETAWPGAIVLHAWLGRATATSDPLDPWAPDPAAVGRRAVRLELGDGVVVRGRVESDEGRSLDGATVELHDVSGGFLRTVATNGAFRFPPVPRASLVGATVRAWESDLARSAAYLAPSKGDAVDVALRVPETASVTGRCVDSRGDPVARVSCYPPRDDRPFPTPVLSGEGGAFEVTVARRGDDVCFLPPPPFAARVVPVRPLERADLGDVVLEHGGRILGRVELDADLPFPGRGMGWWVECESLSLRTTRRVEAGRDDSFEVDGVGPGEHVLRTSWGSHAPDVLLAQGEARGAFAGDEDVVLRVHRCGRLRIDARTADGKPAVVRGWRVEATGPLPDETVTVRTMPDRGRDRAQGMPGFVVGLPRPGRYRLRAKLPGFEWVEREEVVSDSEPLDLVVVPDRRR